MPYHVRRDSGCPAGKPWAVVDDNNHKYGCHASAEEARGQQSALYAAEPETRKEVDRPRLLQAILDLGSFLARPQETDVSFYDEQALAQGFSVLEIPALAPEPEPPADQADAADLFKEQHKLIGKIAFPPADFAIVRDRNRPETWGILLAENAPGIYTPQSLRRAASMLAPQHPAFSAMQLAAHEITGALRRIHAEMNKLNLSPSQMPAPVLKAAADTLSVQTVSATAQDDRLRWFVIYSNNTRDDDYPPDILSASAQKSFAYLVKSGAVPPPELRIWHLPNTRLGVADLVDTVDIDGVTFAYASGLVDAGQEQALLKAQALGLDHVSHAAPGASVIRRTDDNRVVDFFASTELSLLPRDRAANKATGLILKGDTQTMALSPEQRDALAQIYQDNPGMVDAVEQALERLQAATAGRETKEASPAPEAPAAEPAAPAPEYVTRAEMEGLVGTLAAQLNQITEQLEGMRKEATPPPAADPTPETMTPRASLADMLTGMLAFQKEAVIKTDAALAKAAPEQAPAETRGVTGIPLLDQWIN